MAAYSSAGRVLLVTWAATVDPADVPMMRSASVTSTPASDRPAMGPSSHALPAAPAPARTKARLFELPACRAASTCWSGIGQFPCRGARVTAMPSEVVVEPMRRVEEGVVFMGVAFRELPGGRSRWRLPQSRDRGLQGSTRCGYCVHGTPLLPIDHDRRRLARRRRGAQSASCRLPCHCRTRRPPLHPYRSSATISAVAARFAAKARQPGRGLTQVGAREHLPEDGPHSARPTPRVTKDCGRSRAACPSMSSKL